MIHRCSLSLSTCCYILSGYEAGIAGETMSYVKHCALCAIEDRTVQFFIDLFLTHFALYVGDPTLTKRNPNFLN